MSILDIVLAIFKVLGIVITGLVAILSTRYQFRRGNSLTKWGRIAIYTATLSILTSVIAQSIESYLNIRRNLEATEESKSRAANMEKALFDIQRTMMPLKDLEASVSITLPLEKDNRFDLFRRRFETKLSLVLGSIKPREDDFNPRKLMIRPPHERFFTINSYDRDENNRLVPYTITIKPKSQLFPFAKKEAAVRQAIHISLVEFKFYREKLPKIDENFFVHGGKNPPALSVQFSKDNRFSPMDFEYDIKKKRFILHSLLSEQKFMNEEFGPPLAIPDLSRTHLYISIPESYTVLHRNRDLDHFLRKNLTFNYIALSIGKRTFWLKGKHIEPLVAPNGRTVWYYKFPNNIDNLTDSSDD